MGEPEKEGLYMKLAWLLKQLLPLSYSSKYSTPDGVRHYTTWRMYLGRCFCIKTTAV